MAQQYYSGAEVKRMFGENGLKGLDPRIELEQIAVKLSERADQIVKRESVSFPEAYKRAARQKPEMIRRYRELMEKSSPHMMGSE